MPPVWGQSASCSRCYACFTEEWSVCLNERKPQRRGMHIDRCNTLHIYQYGCKNVGRAYFMTDWSPWATTKLPKYHWTTKNPIYVFSKPLLTAKLYYIEFLGFGGKINSPSEIDWNSIGFIIDFYSIILFKLWFLLLLPSLSNSSY